MGHSRWNILPSLPEDHPLRNSDYPPLIIQLLYNRGIAGPPEAESFFTADERLSGDPFLLPDMDKAVSRIYQAMLGGENIVVYGDFDTDGVTSTATLVQGLSLLNAKVTPYIPHRLTEGYGIKATVLEELKKQGASLVITVDSGITALAEVKKTSRLGLDIIITDHHMPPAEVPPVTAVIDPKLPSSKYPFTELAGVGVALKLLQALFRGVGKEDQLEKIMDLVAVGTVADVMPLLGENRYLVKRGLKQLNASPRLGIREMLSQPNMNNLADIDSDSISWIIAPRLNAAGRLAHAMSSYRLLMTDSPEEAHQIAQWLEQKNVERQTMTAKALDRARQQVLSKGILPLLIASDESFPPGICGLVASRLAEEFYRPVVVIKRGEQVCTGSCRSIPEFNIIQALNQCEALFTHFGGHAQAAGFSLPTKNLPAFHKELVRYATAQLDGIDLRPRLDVEVETTLPELGGDTYPTIQKFAPFGRGNPAPVFVSRKVELIECRTMGSTGEHLRFKFRQNGSIWSGVGFGLANYLGDAASPLDIVYNLEMDHWNGAETLRLNVLDFAPSAKK